MRTFVPHIRMTETRWCSVPNSGTPGVEIWLLFNVIDIPRVVEREKGRTIEAMLQRILRSPS